MKPVETLFCQIMEYSLHSEKILPPETKDAISSSLPELIQYSKRHGTLTSLYTCLCRLAISLSSQEASFFQATVTAYAKGTYQMISFTQKVVSLLKQASLPYYLLKGVSLLSLYSPFECRRFGDVDILIPDPAVRKKAHELLLSHGFTQISNLADHHWEYTFSQHGHTFLLEVHNAVIESQENTAFNQTIQEIFQKVPYEKGYFAPADLSFSTLPVTYNGFYLLLHMLHHFLSSGFGIKLLMDWCLYLEQFHSSMDIPLFQNLLKKTGLEGFYSAMTLLCKNYLGLSKECLVIPIQTSYSQKYLEELMAELLDAGEFGTDTTVRMPVVSQEQRHFYYFHQIHLQMKHRFPKKSHYGFLWPFLWIATIFCFLWNNHFLRKAHTKTILKTARKRQKLINQLKLYQ